MHAEPTVEMSPTDRPIFGLPVHTGILFCAHKGAYQPRVEKSKTKLLRKLSFLGRFLDADEKIVFVTTGCSPYTMLEQATIGAEYHNGRKEKFACIPHGDRAIIQRFNFVTSECDRRSENPQRNHLCPSCTGVLPTAATVCPTCGLEFKNKAKAWRRSVLLPGGGYFYTNHPFLGIGDAVAESYLLLLTIVTLSAGLCGDAKAMVVFPMFLGILALEKLITVYHSHSFLAEFIPVHLKRLLREGNVPVVEAAPEPTAPIRQQRPEDVLSVR